MNDERNEEQDDMPDIPHDPGSLEGITAIRLDCNDLDLKIVTDTGLHEAIRLTSDPGQNSPTLIREGHEIVIHQRGRYRGSTTVLSVPPHGCPPITGSHDRGGVTFENVNADLGLAHGSGDIRLVGGIGPVDIASGRGTITIDGRSGEIAIKSGNGDVRAVDCAGGLGIAVGRGNVTVDASDGTIEAKSGAGDVTVTDCSGTLTVKNASGDVGIVRPRNMWVIVSSGSGDVVVRGGSLHALNVRAGRGDIMSTANLVLERGHTAMSSEDPDAPAEPPALPYNDPFGINERLRAKGLEFVAGDKGVRISGGPFEFEASDEGLRFGRGSFSFVADDKGIRIIRGDQEEQQEPFDISTAKGDISIDVPSSVPTRVEAIISSGDISSDIPLVSVGRPGPKGSTQRFVGVSGSPTASERLNVRLKTNRGDIRVRSVAQPARQAAPPAPPNRPRGSTAPFAPPRPPAPRDQAATTRIQTPPAPMSRDERMRQILDALSRGDLSVDDAERQLAALDRERFD